MKRLLYLAPLLLVMFTALVNTPKATAKKDKPKLCLTFDDGNPSDMPGYSWQEWNNLLLQNLKKHHLQAVFFSAGKFMDNDKGREVLTQWNTQGHLIANHTYSHYSYNNPSTSFEKFSQDFLRNDSLINRYSNYTRLFRFPYLKEGDTEEKRDQFRNFLKEQQYCNGYVTIDASDWAINTRLVKRLKTEPKADISPYKQFYLEHLYNRAMYYNELSQKLTGRQINHTLLLHHNLAAALFTDDLIRLFKSKGWEVINAGEAYKDEIYTRIPKVIPAGESLIWALAKENGGYENVLRYPAEDSKYEDPQMDKLGL